MTRRLPLLAVAFAVAVFVAVGVLALRHTGPPATVTVTPAAARVEVDALTRELDGTPVAAEASATPTAAPSSSEPKAATPAPSTPAVVPVAVNHRPAPLPAATIDAKPAAVTRTVPRPAPVAAETKPAAVEGPQPSSAPVWMRDPDTGYCFQADPNTTADQSAADPSCADPANRPAPATGHDNGSAQQTRTSEIWLYDSTMDRCYRTGPAEAEAAGHPRTGDTECAGYANGARDATTPVHDANHPAG